jgi:hypothetical protein
MTMKKIEPQFDPAWFTPEGWEEGIELAFCPTGEGGGIDNSCSSRGPGSFTQLTARQARALTIDRAKELLAERGFTHEIIAVNGGARHFVTDNESGERLEVTVGQIGAFLKTQSSDIEVLRESPTTLPPARTRGISPSRPSPNDTPERQAMFARREEVRQEIARVKRSEDKSGLAKLRKERAKLNKQLAESAGVAVSTERDTRSRLERDIDKIKFKEGGRASKNTWKITSTGGSAEYVFKTESGRKFTVKASRNLGFREPGSNIPPVKSINIIFTDENESTMRTGRGEAFTVFRNVTPAVAAIVRRDRPEKVSFSASGQSRVDLYTKLTKTVLKLTPGHRAFKQGSGGYAYFNIYREDAVPANLDTVEYQEIKLAEGIEIMGWEELDPEIDPLWFVEEGWDEEGIDVEVED